MIKDKKNSIIIIVCTILIAIIGVIFVYSASRHSALNTYGDSFFYMKKQIIGVGLGIVGMFITSKLSYKIYKKFYIPFYIFGLVMLLLVFVPFLSKSSYGATRWIAVGGITIQPSEIAKFCLIIFLASYLSKVETINSIKRIIFVFLMGGLYLICIMLEPNMSITICVGLTILFMLFISGLKLKTFMMLGIPILCAGVLLVVIEPYRLSRIVAFLNPWENPLQEGYQLIQSLYAIGSGGLFGVGLFNSRQAQLFLPFAESDFIFSIISEEIGFLGASCVILLYLILVITIFKVGFKATNKYASFLCFGIGAILGIQVILNIAVVTGSIPPTGLPLPLISAGSTSLLVFMSAIGVVLNVDRQSRKTKI
ncbi:MAG: putative lipid II flippase FtsW [Clostridia bacterium]|nr:putative lipid II flippase FtsW [Clostridia bacterium]